MPHKFVNQNKTACKLQSFFTILLYRVCDTQGQLQASSITGTPAFISLKGQPQNESTELESLMYSMLYAATKGKLHWGAYLRTDSAARDAKVAAMSSGSEFEALVLSRIGDALLKRIAKCL